METLIERTNEALKFMKIGHNDLIRTQNLYRNIPGNNGPTLVGTILEYYNKDGVRTYAVYTLTGWAKEWPIDKGDILDMIWSMEYNDFSYEEIAQILNITKESAEMKHREACERKLGGDYDG
jgi:hypothetical protein